MIKIIAVLCSLSSPVNCHEKTVTTSDFADISMQSCLIGAPQLASQEFGELIPGHGDELVGAAPRARAGPVAQPAATQRRSGDARAMPDGAGQVAQQRRRVGVAVERRHGRDVTGFDAR